MNQDSQLSRTANTSWPHSARGSRRASTTGHEEGLRTPRGFSRDPQTPRRLSTGNMNYVRQLLQPPTFSADQADAGTRQSPSPRVQPTRAEANSGKGLGSPKSPAFANVGLTTRKEVQSAFFRACDLDKNGYLNLSELIRFAEMTGCEGGLKELTVLYETTCSKHSEDRQIGITLPTFVKFTDDEADGVYFPTDELRSWFRKPNVKHEVTTPSDARGFSRRHSARPGTTSVSDGMHERQHARPKRRNSTGQSAAFSSLGQAGADMLMAKKQEPVLTEQPLQQRSTRRFSTTSLATTEHMRVDQPSPPKAVDPAFEMCSIMAKQHNMSFEDVRQRWEEFHKFDVDGNGMLSKSEFVAVIRLICGIPSHREVPEHLLTNAWSAADKDGNDSVDFQEFITWCFSHQNSEEMLIADSEERDMRHLARKLGCSILELERVKEKFDKFDTDKSGSIEEDEFKNVIMFLWNVKRAEDVPAKRLERLWRDVNPNGNRHVFFDAFAAWYIRQSSDFATGA